MILQFKYKATKHRNPVNVHVAEEFTAATLASHPQRYKLDGPFGLYQRK